MLRCAPARIDEFHEKLRQCLSDELLGAIEIGPLDGARATHWKRKGFAGDVVFEMRGARYPVFANVEGRSRNCPVVQLAGVSGERNEVAWMSWRERWMTEQHDSNLQLKDVGMTFWWGVTHDVYQSLFRAEWEAAPRELELEGDVRRTHSAHPHWHFVHQPFGCQVYLGKLHLGMAGWECSSEELLCWQRFPKDTGDLITWASRTVAYSRLQLVHYSLT